MVKGFYEKGGITYRLLLSTDNGNWMIEYENPKEPALISFADFASFIQIPAPERALQIDSPGPGYEKTRLKRLETLQELISDDIHIMDRNTRIRTIKSIAGRSGVSEKTLRKWYYSYLSGAGLYSKKRENGVKELTPNEKTFRWAINKYYYSSRRASLRNAYDLMLVAKYTDDEGKLREKYPTWGQFRYFFYSKARNSVKKVISQNGIGYYQRNTRPLYGSANQGQENIGVYQLDATVADIHLVSRQNRKQVIGRPNIYLAVDTATRLITGMYVGLDSGEEAVMALLRQAACDKMEYCKRYGIDITPEQWPNSGLPGEIVTDRGKEFISSRMDEICARYGIVSTGLPPYRPELKGLVESALGAIQERYKHQLVHLGVIDDDFQQKGLPDYRREAALNIYEFTQVVIHAILYYNAAHVQKSYIRSAEMAEDGIKPIAADLWRWHAERDRSIVIPISDEYVCHVLLPRGTGYFTRRGLEFRHLTYFNHDYDTRCAAAGLNGKEQAQVAYDPQSTNCIYLLEDGEYIALELTPAKKQFKGATYTEVQAFLQNERRIKRELQERETAGRVEAAAHIKEIAKSALAERKELHGMEVIESTQKHREQEAKLIEGKI